MDKYQLNVLLPHGSPGFHKKIWSFETRWTHRSTEGKWIMQLESFGTFAFTLWWVYLLVCLFTAKCHFLTDILRPSMSDELTLKIEIWNETFFWANQRISLNKGWPWEQNTALLRLHVCEVWQLGQLRGQWLTLGGWQQQSDHHSVWTALWYRLLNDQLQACISLWTDRVTGLYQRTESSQLSVGGIYCTLKSFYCFVTWCFKTELMISQVDYYD